MYKWMKNYIWTFWIISTVSLIYGKFFDPMFDGFIVLFLRQLVFEPTATHGLAALGPKTRENLLNWLKLIIYEL